jgi:hypothetical protein
MRTLGFAALIALSLQAAAAPSAIEDLRAYLAKPAADRPDPSTQSFSSIPLTKAESQQARQLLLDDHAATIRATRQKDWDDKSITIADHTLRWKARTFGAKPKDGWNLYISMHGGGNAPAALNDQQWENQIKLYQPADSLYIAPRGPTNNWNLWHEAHVDVLYNRLLEDAFILGEVNPNRVYIMGYSAGGDGVYQLAPRMADRLAAAAMMAGHPNDASPLGLRNIGFTIHVGALDDGYKRNQVAAEWGKKLDALHQADPAGYAHEVKLHEGRAHWMNLEDKVAVEWMAGFTRTPLPEKVVWKQSSVTHDRFYWLAVGPGEKPKGGQLVIASRANQTIAIEDFGGITSLTVLLNDQMLDLDRPVKITYQGRELFKGTASRTIRQLSQTLSALGDPFLMFDAAVDVRLESPAAQPSTSPVSAQLPLDDDWSKMRPITPRGYVCYRAKAPITIDGRADDSAWADASWSEDFMDIEGSRRPAPRFRTRMKMLWDDDNLYVLGDLQEPHVWGTITKKNAVIFHDNDFEIFINPTGDNHNYYEFEMNALNTIWELTLEKPYRDGGPARLGTNIEGLRSAVHIDGTLNDPADTDRSWSVEIAIPWKGLAKYAGEAKPCPPRDGDQWRMNFSRVEWLIDIIDGKYRKIPKEMRPEDNWVWSPQGVIDMHRPERWGCVQFSTDVPGSVSLKPDPTLAARDALMEVYHRQRAFHERYKRYAATREELGTSAGEAEWKLTTDGYVASVREGSHTVHTRQDSKIWEEQQ